LQPLFQDDPAKPAQPITTLLRLPSFDTALVNAATSSPHLSTSYSNSSVLHLCDLSKMVFFQQVLPSVLWHCWLGRASDL